MKAKKNIVESICLLLAFYLFYEGIYKIASHGNYAFWLYHSPFLRPGAIVLSWVLPLIEVIVAFLLPIASTKKAGLYGVIVLQVFFIFYIISTALFSHRLFWPFQAFWSRPSWFEKMLQALVISWVAFVAIIMTERKIISNKNLRIRGEAENP